MSIQTNAVSRAAISLAILAAGGIGFYLLGTPEVPTQTPQEPPPPLVETQPAEAHQDGISFDVDGVVVAYREISIAAEVAGKVAHKSDACRSGRTVRKGDVLIRIEPDDYELEVKRLQEELNQAYAMISELAAEIQSIDNQIQSSREQLAIDSRLLKRSQELMSRSAASDSEVDSVRKAELATRNTLQSQIDQKNLLIQRQRRMNSAKSLVQANLEKAQLDLQRTEIVSPIDGVVVSESVEQGGYIQPGGAMVVIQDTSQLDVTCQLYMKQMHWLWQGESSIPSSDADRSGYEFPTTPATVIYELGGQSYAWDAKVDRYDGTGIDNRTRMVRCRVHVNDPTAVRPILDRGAAMDPVALVAKNGAEATAQEQVESEEVVPENDPQSDVNTTKADEIIGDGNRLSLPTLMTGMFVKVRIHANPPIPFVRLPQEAIQPGNTIWVVNDGRLEKKKVSLASSTKEHAIAYQHSGGLRSGDLVVVSPLATPVDGMKVSTSKEEYAKALQKMQRDGPGGSWGGGGKGPGGGGKRLGETDGKKQGKPNRRPPASDQSNGGGRSS